MRTFDLTLTTTWQEVLNGGSSVSFDVLSGTTIEVYFSENATTPTGDGNKVFTFGDDWDFSASGMVPGVQRIWVKGAGEVRGVQE